MTDTNLEAVPQAMKESPRWVLWRAEQRGDKLTKVPHQANGRKAKANDPGTWTTFDLALTAADDFDGLGFVLGDGIAGVDLDKCLDPQTGDLDPAAAAILNRLQSYTEISPSGTGLHVLCRGELPPGGRRKGHLELYDRDRFFCVTGLHLEGTPADLQDRQAELAAIHADTFGSPPAPAGETATKTKRPRQTTPPAARNDFPAAKHEALYANDETYRRTWDHERPDLRDASPSGYDLALANLAAKAGLEREEIAALLYERRRRRGEDPDKALREDYLKTTIGKALESLRGEQIVAGQTEPDSPEECVAALAEKLAIPLTNVQRITGAEPLFRFHLGNEVAAIPAKALLNQATFRAAIYAACGEPPKQQKRGEAWDNILRAIHRAAEVLDAGADATLDGELRAWLEDYLAANRPIDVEPGTALDHPRHPFLRDGRVWINIGELGRFLTYQRNVRMQQGVLCQRLRACGGEPGIHRVKSGKEATTGRYWGLPWAP